jgi:high-affinity iron transporter
VGLLATYATWIIVVGVIALAGATASELDIQAATGLLALVVLVVVMNWFFHKTYWEGWMSFHSRKKQELVAASGAAAWRGLALLGLASVYREGFEVVLFLQSIRVQVGTALVAAGGLIGLGLTGLVALLTFVGHRRLPYQKLLLVTGGMLGAVFVVMVGEQAQEMQLAGWLPTTPLGVHLPAWLGVWFSVFPTAETVAAQGIAAVLVLASYVLARQATRRRLGAARLRTARA